MSEHRRRLDRETAERLLRGQPATGSAAGLEPLTDVLHAAAGPARADELAGQGAALAAFREAHEAHEAHLGTRTPARRGSMIKTTLAKLVTVKIAAVVAATTAGGMAVAAGTGHLPLTNDGDGPGRSASAGDHPTGRPTGTPADADPTRAQRQEQQDSTGNRGGNATPSPSLEGLCRAYAAGVASNPGKALDNPAFTVLISAAGGRDRVDAFCDDLLDSTATGTGTGTGTERPHPTGQPEQRPTPHPTGRPTDLPLPSGPPDGRPTVVPSQPDGR